MKTWLPISLLAAGGVAAIVVSNHAHVGLTSNTSGGCGGSSPELVENKVSAVNSGGPAQISIAGETLLGAEGTGLVGYAAPTDLAVRSDATRAYVVTQQLPDPLQRTLAVLKLMNGRVADLSTFSINPSVPIPDTVQATSSRVLLDERRKILYVATYYSSARAPVLSTFRLTEDGDPDGTAPLVTPLGTGYIYALVLHPTLPVLYVGGEGNASSNCLAYRLDATTRVPLGSGVPCVVGPTTPKVADLVYGDPTGSRLYILGTKTGPIAAVPATPTTPAIPAVPPTPALLGAITLDPSGMPRPPANSQTFWQTVPWDSLCDRTGFPRMRYAAGALYFRRDQVDSSSALAYATPTDACPVMLWQLDAVGGLVSTGQPVVSPTVFRSDVASSSSGELWLASPDRYTDAFDGTSKVAGAAIAPWNRDPTGLPNVPAGGADPFTYPNRRGVLLELAEGTVPPTPVVITMPRPATGEGAIPPGSVVRGWQVQVTLLESDVPTPVYPGIATGLTYSPVARMCPVTNFGCRSVGGPQGARAWQVAPLDVGVPSDPYPLDALLSAAGGAPVMVDRVGDALFSFLLTTSANSPGCPDPGASCYPGTARVRIEILDAANTPVRAFEDEAKGGVFGFYVPRYGPSADRTASIRAVSQDALIYRNWARAVAPDGAPRPRLFRVSCSNFVGYQGNLGQLDAYAETVARLGCNVVYPQGWDFQLRGDLRGLSPQVLQEVLQRWSLRTEAGVGGTPSAGGNILYAFTQNFTQNLPQNLTDIGAWAQALKSNSLLNDITPETDVALFALWDEPGVTLGFLPRPGSNDCNEAQGAAGKDPLWSLGFEGASCPAPRDPNAPDYWESFLRYLESPPRSLSPSDFAVQSWDRLPRPPLPPRAVAANATSRKVFYWAMRFFSDELAAGSRELRLRIQAAYSPTTRTFVNLQSSGALNAWFAQNYDADQPEGGPPPYPDQALIRMGWFESGRANMGTLWAEDYFPDAISQDWAVIADMLRSAAMLETDAQGFGGYVAGPTVGGLREGASYKILSLLGRGAKDIGIYSFGPSSLTNVGTWSDSPAVYAPIARALQRVARAEPVLFGGQPARARIALQAPGSSRMWLNCARGLACPTWNFELEPRNLHYALTHAGYTVDFLDDDEIARGRLGEGYAVLYMTQPNLQAEAHQAVATWVNAGGTLVVTPGAALNDQYNDPYPGGVSALLGLDYNISPRAASTSIATSGGSAPSRVTPYGQAVIADAGGFGPSPVNLQPIQFMGGELPTPGGAVAQITDYRSLVPAPNAAAIVARFSTGGAAITVQTNGRGRAITYAFFPGLEYYVSPVRTLINALPSNWSDEKRSWVTAPVDALNLPRRVTVARPDGSVRPGIEALRLDSTDPHGIAVTLLNWFEVPTGPITVSLPIAPLGTVSSVTSVEQGLLDPSDYSLRGGILTIRLSTLRNVDILIVRP